MTDTTKKTYTTEEIKEWYATKRAVGYADTMLAIAVLLIGFHYSLFDWEHWWYSLYALISCLSIGCLRSIREFRKERDKDD